MRISGLFFKNSIVNEAGGRWITMKDDVTESDDTGQGREKEGGKGKESTELTLHI